MRALYVILLYLGIQTVESYLITPLIQQKTVSLPPALTISKPNNYRSYQGVGKS